MLARKGWALIQLICWLLPPSVFKNRILTRFGHRISLSASIGPTIVWKVKRVDIGDDARLGLLNVFRGLTQVVLEERVIIESWNWISAHPVFQELDPEAGTFFMANHAKVGSRNYLDSSGTIIIREHARLGGNRCLLQTHQADQIHSRRNVGRITIGHHSVVGSCAVMLMGAFLPDQSMLAANSTMTHRSGQDKKRGLYVGSPATWKRETSGTYFEGSHAYYMTACHIEGPMGILVEDRFVSDLPTGGPVGS